MFRKQSNYKAREADLGTKLARRTCGFINGGRSGKEGREESDYLSGRRSKSITNYSWRDVRYPLYSI